MMKVHVSVLTDVVLVNVAVNMLGDPGNRRVKKNKRFNEAIADDDNKIYENIDRKDVLPSKQDLLFIEEALKDHFFFANLNDEELHSVSRKMFLCTSKQSSYVFKQEDSASCFFIVRQGQVSVEIDGVEKKILGKLGTFGELALLYNAPRSASIKNVTDCEFWAIDRTTFKEVVSEVTTKQYKENKEFLTKVAFFESMTEKQKELIAGVLVPQRFKPEEAIISEGDAASSYYIIYTGTAKCVKNGNVIRELTTGQSFGEQALYDSGHRTLTVVAGENCKCLALSRGDLRNILGTEQIRDVISGNWSRWAIEKDPVFQNLTKLQIEKWIQNAEISKPEKNQILLSKDSTLTAIVIVLNGELSFGSKIYQKGSVFGADYLYPKENVGRL